MTIDPKWGFAVSLAHAVLLALSGLAWATVLDAKTAAAVVFTLASIDAIAQAVINGFSSKQEGPLVK